MKYQIYNKTLLFDNFPLRSKIAAERDVRPTYEKSKNENI